jgi:hypothetical protein
MGLQPTTTGLDRIAFHRYLQSAAEQCRSYPYRGDWSCDCPLAQYLRARGHRVAQVSRTEYYLSGPDDAHPLPAWAVTFVAGIDRKVLVALTAEHALTILDQTQD